MNNKTTQPNNIFNNKAIQDLKKIFMTPEEKRAVLARIISSPVPIAPIAKNRPVKSPWSAHSFSVWISRNRWAYAVVTVLLIISLTGGGVAFAAEGSLPGDLFYPIKINVTEPLRVALTPSLEAKASLAASFANERVQEGETLAAQGKLDQAKQAELSSLIAVHTQALNSALTAIASSEPQVAERIRIGFQERMNEHAIHLYALQTSVTTIATTSAIHIPILDLATSARESGMMISSSTNYGKGLENSHRDINKEDRTHTPRTDKKQTFIPIPAPTSYRPQTSSWPLASSSASVDIDAASSSIDVEMHNDLNTNSGNIPSPESGGHGLINTTIMNDSAVNNTAATGNMNLGNRGNKKR